MGRAIVREVSPAARWLLVALVAGGILVASVFPVPAGGVEPLGPLGLDAWIHALAYVGLAASLLYALEPSERSTRSVIGLALGPAIAFGFAVELIQVPAPTRQFELLDVVANGVGATAAVVVRLGARWLSGST